MVLGRLNVPTLLRALYFAAYMLTRTSSFLLPMHMLRRRSGAWTQLGQARRCCAKSSVPFNMCAVSDKAPRRGRARPRERVKRQPSSKLSTSSTDGDIARHKDRAAPSEVVLEQDIRYPSHQSRRQWVLFSDLHVSVQTLDTCLEVLSRVHDEARARDAGIIFLGDFWHIRGTLRVEVLNRVIAALASWTQPVVMIPGNHDQVSLNGLDHALTPLVAAVGSAAARREDQAPQALIFSQATLFLDALWLPYSRDAARTRAILEGLWKKESVSSAERESGSVRWPGIVPPSISAIFCHVDVRGAAMNDNALSSRGLRPTCFPPTVPTYTGHFHKPHAVPSTRITYIGSPYQTSLAEAGQQKRLLLLSRGDDGKWREEVGVIAMDVGRRYHRITSVGQASGLLTQAGAIRAGDRVVLSVPDSTDPAISTLRSSLGDELGVELEVREQLGALDVDGLASALTPQPASGDVEEMGPTSLWNAYMEQALSGRLQHGVREQGVKLVEEIDAVVGERVGAGKTGAVRLELKSVTLKGYGPYLSAVEYPLDSRGLVLLRGKNVDDQAAESNAAGKSKLAMSPLWALTGEGDERPVMDGRVTDVAFDVPRGGQKVRGVVAEVSVRGRANGEAFEVTRRRSTRLNQLLFTLGGRDMTKQAVKDTERAVQEVLGVDASFLSTAVFCGQHQLSGVLEASDTRLKERLSQLVRLEVWQQLQERARQKLKSVAELTTALGTEIAVLERDHSRQISEQATLLTRLQASENELNVRLSGMNGVSSLEEVEATMTEARRKAEDASVAWESAVRRDEGGGGGGRDGGLEERIGALTERVRLAEDCVEEGKQLKTEIEARWHANAVREVLVKYQLDRGMAAAVGADVESELMGHFDVTGLSAQVAALESQLGERLQAAGAAAAELGRARRSLSWLEEGGNGTNDMSSCPTCGRAWEVDERGRDDVRGHLEEEVERLAAQAAQAEEDKRQAEEGLRDARNALEVVSRCMADVAEWQEVCRQLDERGRQLEDLHGKLTEETASRAMRRQQEQSLQQELKRAEKQYFDSKSRYEELQADFPRILQLHTDLKAQQRVVDDARSALEAMRAHIAALRMELDSRKAQREGQDLSARILKEVVEAFGVRGVQAFVLRGAVSQLEALANRYLNFLSEGSLRARLTLDGERISKEVQVRGADGTFLDRSLSQLSGGQWRRASLSFLLAFRELSRLRASVDCNVLVLDEVLNHLDGPGRARVGRLLKAMCSDGAWGDGDASTRSEKLPSSGLSTIIVILQDLVAYEMEDSFDCVDEVVKERDVSTVVVDSRRLDDDDDPDDEA